MHRFRFSTFDLNGLVSHPCISEFLATGSNDPGLRQCRTRKETCLAAHRNIEIDFTILPPTVLAYPPSRSVANLQPGRRPELSMSGHTRRDGRLSLHWALSGCSDPTRPGDRASPQPDPRGYRLAPWFRLMRRPASSTVATQVLLERGESPSIRRRGMSPSPVSLAEHRVLFGVGHELPDLLRTAATDGDLGSPGQRLLA